MKKYVFIILFSFLVLIFFFNRGFAYYDEGFILHAAQRVLQGEIPYKDFDLIYTHANESYNKGYEKLGHPEYKKYILKHVDGKIGGHCVLQNCPFLDSWISSLIQEENDK